MPSPGGLTPENDLPNRAFDVHETVNAWCDAAFPAESGSAKRQQCVVDVTAAFGRYVRRARSGRTLPLESTMRCRLQEAGQSCVCAAPARTIPSVDLRSRSEGLPRAAAVCHGQRSRLIRRRPVIETWPTRRSSHSWFMAAFLAKRV